MGKIIKAHALIHDVSAFPNRKGLTRRCLDIQDLSAICAPEFRRLMINIRQAIDLFTFVSCLYFYISKLHFQKNCFFLLQRLFVIKKHRYKLGQTSFEDFIVLKLKSTNKNTCSALLEARNGDEAWFSV